MPRDSPPHSYLSSWSPRLLCQRIYISPAPGSLSVSGVHTCGVGIPISPPQPPPSTGAGAPARSLQLVVWGVLSWGPWCLRLLAALGLVNVPVLLSAALRARDWERSGTRAKWCGLQCPAWDSASGSWLPPVRGECKSGQVSLRPPFKTFPPNRMCCGSVQIPSQLKLTSTTHITTHSVSALLPPAAMVQKWVGGFLAIGRGTASLPRAGHCHAHLHDARVVTFSTHALCKLCHKPH